MTLKTKLLLRFGWYRIWSDKWKEQGALTSALQIGTAETINLPKAMTNTKYVILFSMQRVNTDDIQWFPAFNNSTVTTTSFALTNTRTSGSGTDTFCKRWYVCGY